ncbi:MAG: c-type cytochrome [Pseudomonadales bacterium]|nr:cytochrome c5 family protein [Pseudomonadales bacterium]
MQSFKAAATACVSIVLIALAVPAAAAPVPPGSDEDIRARLAPAGAVCRAGEDCGSGTAAASGAALTGDAVYNQFCFACHASGVGGAPLFADAEAWAPRIAKGMDALMATTLNGLGAMPPRGTCMNCSDEELQAAVDYMLEQVQ